MMDFGVLVVGGGPAGLIAGIQAAKSSSQPVVILERNTEPGKKFLLSGSGQCNVTHGGLIDAFLDHYGGVQKARFVKPALYAFDNRAVIQFFEQRGVPLVEREDGKVFPRSLRSRDLLDALLGDLKSQGTLLRQNMAVLSVEKRDGLFFIRTETEVLRSRELILATGGCSYPSTGSQGDGFRFAEDLGHRIVPPHPALAPVVVAEFLFASLAGGSFRETIIGLERNGKRIRESRGDVLLTHRGLSGPGILNLSRYIEPRDVLRIALAIPGKDDVSGTGFQDDLSANLSILLVGKKKLKNVLAPINISERLLMMLLKHLNISPERPASETTRNERHQMVEALAGFPFIVESLGGWGEAMVTTGGVALEEVDRQTMESRIVPGLFFAGELLNIDGDTGGYNIQFALSSGFLAGQQSAKADAATRAVAYLTSKRPTTF